MFLAFKKEIILILIRVTNDGSSILLNNFIDYLNEKVKNNT